MAQRQDPSQVLVVAVGTGTPERLAKVRAERAPHLPVPEATEAWRAALGVVAFPETLFIDAQGRIAERLQGGQDAAYFDARIHALLAEAEAGAPQAQDGEAPDSGGHGIVARLVYRLNRVRHPGGR